MLSKDNRIPKTIYPTLLKKSRSFVVDGTTVRFTESPKNPMFSMVISGKVSKKAVQRNLIRRIFQNRIKEADLGSKIGKKALFIYVFKDFGSMNRVKINQKAKDIINKICLYFQKG